MIEYLSLDDTKKEKGGYKLKFNPIFYLDLNILEWMLLYFSSSPPTHSQYIHSYIQVMQFLFIDWIHGISDQTPYTSLSPLYIDTITFEDINFAFISYW